MQRVCVVGTTGSGKSTVAAALGECLGCPVVELDALHWEPGWTAASEDSLRARVSKALAGPRWVVDGNYSKLRDLTWDRADTFVWLDLPFVATGWQLVARTFGRAVRREELWNGNRERLAVQLFHRDSLFLWFLKTHGEHRRTYRQVLEELATRGTRTIRLRSRRAIDGFLRDARG